MGKRIGHTIGSLHVTEFASQHADRWHMYHSKDKPTNKAVARAEALGAVVVDRQMPEFPRFKYNRRAE